MQDYLKNISVFNHTQNENLIEITVPVAMDMNYNLLRLSITLLDTGYIICDDGKAFNRFNNIAEYYFNLFKEKDTNDHFDIKLDGDKFFKEYPDNFNIQVAINEFVRFFVYLDDFILKNNII